MRTILIALLMTLATQASAKEIEVWFVANIMVGIERFVDDDGNYKYYSNRVHWVEMLDTYSSNIFKDKATCESYLLSNYSNVFRSNGAKTVISNRDPDFVGDHMSSFFGAESEGFVITDYRNWNKELVRAVPFYTCAMQRIDLSRLK